MLCDYGCGKEARHTLKNGKVCCEVSFRSCDAIRKKNSDGLKRSYECGKKHHVFDDVIRKRSHESRINNLMENPFELWGYKLRYKHISLEQQNKCLICGTSEWMGVPLILHLDHIDGNRANNCRENLRLLCPNCHSQTETYCGKNVNSGRSKVSDDELESVYKETQSIHQTLLRVGLAPKGGNYQRMYRLIERWSRNISDA